MVTREPEGSRYMQAPCMLLLLSQLLRSHWPKQVTGLNSYSKKGSVFRHLIGQALESRGKVRGGKEGEELEPPGQCTQVTSGEELDRWILAACFSGQK